MTIRSVQMHSQKKRQTQIAQMFDLDEIGPVREFIREGKLLVAEPDGCQLGYKDAENGLPNIKPMIFLITLGKFKLYPS